MRLIVASMATWIIGCCPSTPSDRRMDDQHATDLKSFVTNPQFSQVREASPIFALQYSAMRDTRTWSEISQLAETVRGDLTWATMFVSVGFKDHRGELQGKDPGGEDSNQLQDGVNLTGIAVLIAYKSTMTAGVITNLDCEELVGLDDENLLGGVNRRAGLRHVQLPVHGSFPGPAAPLGRDAVSVYDRPPVQLVKQANEPGAFWHGYTLSIYSCHFGSEAGSHQTTYIGMDVLQREGSDNVLLQLEIAGHLAAVRAILDDANRSMDQQ